MDAIYGCDTCRTTIGRQGCPTHKDKPTPIGANMFITTCMHGVDLRFNPRCYICKPMSETQINMRERIIKVLAKHGLTNNRAHTPRCSGNEDCGCVVWLIDDLCESAIR